MPTYFSPDPFPRQFIDPDTGLLMSGGTIEAYLLSSPTTPTNLFSDNAGTIIGATVTLNAGGFPEHSGAIVNLHYDSEIDYRLVVKNSSGSTVYTSDVSFEMAQGAITGLTALINQLLALWGDFGSDTGGSRDLVEGDFGVKPTSFTHASDIVLTIQEDAIGANKGPAYIYYPESQTGTIQIAKGTNVELRGEIGEKTPGALLTILRITANEFVVKGC